jgi:hypothetical protein
MPVYNHHWKGMLTTGNIDQVAKLFRALLNRKRFTYTSVRPSLVPKIEKNPAMIDTRVNVHTRQKLITGQRFGVRAGIRVTKNLGIATLAVPTDSYLCLFQTDLLGEIGQYDYTHKNPYIAFEGDSVTIKWQTPCGDQAVDVFTLEVR